MKHLLAALIACAAASAQAAPFATTYTGLLAADSGNFSSTRSGEPYTVTLVFDNGSATASSQTWQPGHLTCILWHFNAARDMVYAQNLAATPPTTGTGAVTTAANGALATLFTDLRMVYAYPGSFTSTGFAPVLDDRVEWYVNGSNAVFYLEQTAGIYGNGGGVSVNPADWSSPAPFSGPCAANAPAAAPVPTLGHAGLALLAGLLGAARWRTQRRAL